MFIVLLLLMGSVAVNIFEISKRESYRNTLDGKYRLALYQASGYAEDMLNLIDNAKLARRPDQSAQILADIWRQSALARDSLSQLSSDDSYIGNTMSVLSDISSTSRSLMLKSMDGDYLENADWKKLADAETNVAILCANLRNAVANATDESMRFGHIAETSSDSITRSVSKSTRQSTVRSSLPDISPEREDLSDAAPIEYGISAEEGKIYVESIIENIEDITGISEIIHRKTSGIESSYEQPLLSYTVKLSGGQVDIDISAQTGELLMFLRDEVHIANESVTESEAIEKAAGFLKSSGYTNMIPVFTELFGSCIYIDFVYEENGVSVYPDEVKIKLCLDDGRIEAFNAAKYHISHHNREQKRPALSEEIALELVSQQLDVRNSSLAIINADDGSEVLCYEFHGSFNGGYYAVFINANNGRQEALKRIG